MKVFVYGTLKKGRENHRWLRGSSFIQEDTLKGASMYSLTAFPAVVFDDKNSVVKGEVYEVENLDQLDRLEGYPHLYNRREVVTEQGHQATVYYMDNPEEKVWYSEKNRLKNGEW